MRVGRLRVCSDSPLVVVGVAVVVAVAAAGLAGGAAAVAGSPPAGRDPTTLANVIGFSLLCSEGSGGGISPDSSEANAVNELEVFTTGRAGTWQNLFALPGVCVQPQSSGTSTPFSIIILKTNRGNYSTVHGRGLQFNRASARYLKSM